MKPLKKCQILFCIYDDIYFRVHFLAIKKTSFLLTFSRSLLKMTDTWKTWQTSNDECPPLKLSFISLCWSIFFPFQMLLDRFEISWLTCYRLISFLFPEQNLELLLLCVLSHCPFYCILICAAVFGWMWASQFFLLINVITKHWELWSIFVFKTNKKAFGLQLNLITHLLSVLTLKMQIPVSRKFIKLFTGAKCVHTWGCVSFKFCNRGQKEEILI